MSDAFFDSPELSCSVELDERLDRLLVLGVVWAELLALPLPPGFVIFNEVDY